MKEVLVTIKVKINEPEYTFFREQGMTKERIEQKIRDSVNSAKIESRFISDFEVEDIKEVKE
jgi:hypothetical protein